MRAKILLLIFFLITHSLFSQPCNSKNEPNSKKYGWVSEEVITYLHRHLDMGGVDAHSKIEWIQHLIKKFLPWETKRPRIRYLKNVTNETIIIHLAISDSPVMDSLIITENNNLLFCKRFGGFADSRDTIFCDYSSPKILTFRVSGVETLNNSPGAFQADIEYIKVLHNKIWRLVKVPKN